MFGIYFCDIVMGFYFNIFVWIDFVEIYFFLFCDDVVWDVIMFEFCVVFFGFYGFDLGWEYNLYGI